MISRILHLKDIENRIKVDAKIATHPRAVKVYRSRAARVPEDVPVAVLLYSPEEENTPLSKNGIPQYLANLTIAIEVRIQKLDDWDLEASLVTDLIKYALFTDADWLKRWAQNPSFTVRQFLDYRGEQMLCGEVLTLNVTDRTPQVYSSVAKVIGGIDVTVDVIDHGGPDDAPEAIIKLDTPEE